MTDSGIKILRRNRIYQVLDRMEDYPISVIIAPWGYGKTMAVTDYFRQGKRKYVWITMTAPIKISDVDYFWLLFTHALRPEYPALASRLETLGFPKDMMQFFHFIEEMQSQEIDEDLYIVIDDFQNINVVEIHYFISQIVQAGIHKIHLVLLSREYPDIPIHEWEMKGICNTVTAKTLAFTGREMESYLDQIGFRADRDVRKAMIQLSNGWIAFLYLMAKDYERYHIIDQHATIYSMIRSCIYDTYTEKEKEYLMKLSVLDWFSDELIAELFDDADVVFHILKVHTDNALIVGRPDGTYHFHDLFRSFLQNELQLSHMDVRRFAGRVAEWATSHRRHFLAFKFWMMAEKYDNILAELEEAPVMEVFHVDKKILKQIFSASEEDIYSYPMALLKYIFVVCVEESAETGGMMLREFREKCRELNHPEYSRDHLIAESYILETVLLFNDLDRVIEYIDKAARLLKGKKSAIRIRNSNLTYGSPHMTYAYYNKPGIFKHIADDFVCRFDSHIQVADGNGYGADCVAQAEYGLETGNLEEVEYKTKKALFKAGQYDQTCMKICAYLTLGRLYIMQRRRDRVYEIIRCLKEMSSEVQMSSMLYTLDSAIGYLSATLGEYEGIPQWICAGEFQSSDSAWQRLAFIYIVFGKAVLLKKDYMYLKFQTEIFEEKFRTFDYQLGYIHNYIFAAISDLNLYGIAYAVDSLQKAVDIAVQDGIVAPFAEYLPYISRILHSDQLKMPQKFRRKLTELSAEPAASGGDHRKILTSREMEIMRCMERGMNNGEIAEALYISPNTVKRHIQNIYSKFNVSNKTMALARFRKMREEQEREKLL